MYLEITSSHSTLLLSKKYSKASRSDNKYSVNGSNTCYYLFQGSYGSIKDFEEIEDMNFTILEFDDIFKEEER